MFSANLPESQPFSAACIAPDESFSGIRITFWPFCFDGGSSGLQATDKPTQKAKGFIPGLLVHGHNRLQKNSWKVFQGDALRQGTTLVVPQMLDKKRWALAPEGCFPPIGPEMRLFSQPE
jgi:hypothetical protein